MTVCCLFRRVSPSPTPGSASAVHSPSPRRGGGPAACSRGNIGSQEPRDPPAPCSTRDAPSCPGRTAPSTVTEKEGHIGKKQRDLWVRKALIRKGEHNHRAPLGDGPLAFARRSRAVLDVWWLRRGVTGLRLVRAADVARHQGPVAAFGRAL